ncbi:MAG: DUF2007 domain-containing protein [Planctomycetes bacterium]|nr:DUF2007 domain-containing protein [Planctomycetota bacterium]
MEPQAADTQGATEWTVIRTGPIAEVTVLQAVLESEGIPTFVPDQNMKVIDPFITGINAFDVRLMVPRCDAERAVERLRDPSETSPEAMEYEEWPDAWGEEPDDAADGESSPEGESSRLRDLEARGRRIRWASIALVSSPIALAMAPVYLLETRQLSTRPRGHAYTIAAIIAAAVFTGFELWILYLIMSKR